jgi:arylsulfatase A-like enzyme
MRRLAFTIAVFAVVLLVAAVAHVGPIYGPNETVAATRTGESLLPQAFFSDRGPQIDRPNVVLISIDTLRADHMSLYGYHRPTTPHIDRFASGTRVFDRAYATAPLTSPSVVSMLTGLYPYHHGVRLLWQKVDARNITVADYLRRAGYYAGAVVSNIVLSRSACSLDLRFDDYDDRVDEPEPNRPGMFERSAARTTDAAMQWLRDRRPTDQPFFLWVHYMDPHGPYTPPADAPADFHHDQPRPIEVDRIASYVRVPGLNDGLEYVDRYDEEIATTDREVGRLLEALAEAGLLERAIVVITADHGEQMMEGDYEYFCHGLDVDQSLVHVPLIVRGPSVPPARVPHPVSLVDVTPTILDMVGLELPGGLDGRSLAGTIAQRPAYAEGRDSGGSGGLRRAFIYRACKIVVEHGKSNVPNQAWAFDLESDPHETSPLPVDPSDPAYGALADMIRDEVNPGGFPTEYAHGENPMALTPSGLDEQTRQALTALGYVRN